MERERFPRGSMPPSAFAAVATLAPTAVSAEPPRVKEPGTELGKEPPPADALDPVKHCDLSTTCPQCDSEMRPEHAHYRCASCGYRDSCCF